MCIEARRECHGTKVTVDHGSREWHVPADASSVGFGFRNGSQRWLPEALAESCFTFDGKAWCNDEDGALDRVVAAFDLAKQPRKLSPAEWVALVTFVHASRVLRSPEEAKRTVSSAPEAAVAKVAPPSATIDDGRVVVRFFTAITREMARMRRLSTCSVL